MSHWEELGFIMGRVVVYVYFSELRLVRKSATLCMHFYMLGLKEGVINGDGWNIMTPSPFFQWQYHQLLSLFFRLFWKCLNLCVDLVSKIHLTFSPIHSLYTGCTPNLIKKHQSHATNPPPSENATWHILQQIHTNPWSIKSTCILQEITRGVQK